MTIEPGPTAPGPETTPAHDQMVVIAPRLCTKSRVAPMDTWVPLANGAAGGEYCKDHTILFEHWRNIFAHHHKGNLTILIPQYDCEDFRLTIQIEGGGAQMKVSAWPNTPVD